MLVEVNYKNIQKILNDEHPERPVSEEEAAEAFHNFVGFMNVLIQINDRIGLVKTDKK